MPDLLISRGIPDEDATRLLPWSWLAGDGQFVLDCRDIPGADPGKSVLYEICHIPLDRLAPVAVPLWRQQARSIYDTPAIETITGGLPALSRLTGQGLIPFPQDLDLLKRVVTRQRSIMASAITPGGAWDFVLERDEGFTGILVYHWQPGHRNWARHTVQATGDDACKLFLLALHDPQVATAAVVLAAHHQEVR